MKKYIAIASVMLFVGACASSPSYREAASERSFGYSEQVLESDRYRIQYRLNDDHVGRAQDYALLRAAELTMEKGYSTFQVVSQTADVNADERPSSRIGFERDYAISRSCGLLGCASRATPVTTVGAGFGSTTLRDDETVVTIEILMSNRNAALDGSYYDASEVAANIRSRM